MATNKFLFVTDLHVFPELKIISELLRALSKADHVVISPPPVELPPVCLFTMNTGIRFVISMCIHMTVFIAVLSHICMKLSKRVPYAELHIKFDFRHG